jgi:osmotically-inducible protein OsmY
MTPINAAPRPVRPSHHFDTPHFTKLDGRIRGDSRPQPVQRGHCMSELKDRVAAALVNSGYAALSFVGCDVEQNRVILCGSVPSYHLKQLAQVCAQRVEGIGRVDNRLEVRGRASR